jgi:hypothetical protein
MAGEIRTVCSTNTPWYRTKITGAGTAGAGGAGADSAGADGAGAGSDGAGMSTAAAATPNRGNQSVAASLHEVIFNPAAYMHMQSEGLSPALQVAVSGQIVLLDLKAGRLEMSQPGAKLTVDVVWLTWYGVQYDVSTVVI